jgi:AcrR family transcriptional regulator
MRYKPGHKEESRARILEAAGRGFRRHGLGGIGVDGLAREAGVTSGAFYVHFPSKSAAFEEAAVAGLEQLLASVERLQAQGGATWIEVFVDHYLGFKRTCLLDDACGLQALTPEVIRAGDAVRQRYQATLTRIAERVAQGLPQRPGAPSTIERAWALLALLSGGVTMTRALADEALSQEVAAALKKVALAVAG